MGVRARSIRQRATMSEEQRYYLLTGHDFFHGYGRDERGGVAPSAARDHWLEHRNELLGYWTQDPSNDTGTGSPEPGGPFSRPWAWWQFVSPGPRLKVREGRNGGRAAVDEEDAPEWAKKYSFGVPSVYSSADPREWPQYEDEKTYLIRHNLLTIEEKRILRRSYSYAQGSYIGHR